MARGDRQGGRACAIGVHASDPEGPTRTPSSYESYIPRVRVVHSSCPSRARSLLDSARGCPTRRRWWRPSRTVRDTSRARELD